MSSGSQSMGILLGCICWDYVHLLSWLCWFIKRGTKGCLEVVPIACGFILMDVWVDVSTAWPCVFYETVPQAALCIAVMYVCYMHCMQLEHGQGAYCHDSILQLFWLCSIACYVIFVIQRSTLSRGYRPCACRWCRLTVWMSGGASYIFELCWDSRREKQAQLSDIETPWGRIALSI